ncbi:ATP-binding protein [Prolixibacter denitrificans]|uniref:histidine kinase n=1 Tax=Prolixibacter denitrificans TaxID=1541063 RepID=A0A2P8CBB2_9BACT|nr:ATP-binding protein [Prolixibacter denitrificans]PSK82269.1 signal transduction histidine kinase [Prolixibacter denitrificans]GET22982.1 two-component sensor histidine kinase [Prolixibacter denitrificans]
MKIRNKITLIFTLLAGSVLLVIMVFIYIFSDRYTDYEFYQRLSERANIIAGIHFEKDEVSSEMYAEIQEKYLHKLSEEKETIIPTDSMKRLINNQHIPRNFSPSFLVEILSKKHARFRTGKIYHVGILYFDNQGNFVVIVSAKNRYGQAQLNNLLHVLLIAFFIGMIVIYFIGRLYAGKVLQPMAAITEKAKDISAHNLHLRLDATDNKDEISELAVTFNHMLDRLETAFQLQSNFVNNASHELRNPLTAILGEAEVSLQQERSADDYKKALQIIEKESERLDSLITSLLKLAQAGNTREEVTNMPVRIDELLVELVHEWENTNPDNQIRLDMSRLPEESGWLSVRGDESLLWAAFSNIIGNACKFSNNKEVVVGITGKAGSVTVSVKDQGVGIAEAELQNIAEPFYRGTNARSFEGFGIGLSLAHRIIKLHGGTLTISSVLQKGTEVTVSFPTKV